MFSSYSSFTSFAKSFVPPVLAQRFRRSFGLSEVYPVKFYPSNNNAAPRLNLLLPTLEPSKIYGGISTALRIFENILAAYPHYSIRIIITSDVISSDALKYIVKRFDRHFQIDNASFDVCSDASLYPLYTSTLRQLPISPQDIFVATAWWTADLANRAILAQNKFFNSSYQYIYLIQDWEPLFYPYSSNWLLADSTYRHSNMIAIINSEELYSFFVEKYSIDNAFYIPFVLNSSLNNRLVSCRENSSLLPVNQRDKIILVYARPSVPRNCYDTVCAVIQHWNSTYPNSSDWKIYFIGEDLSLSTTHLMDNVEVLGRLSLEQYSELLSKSAIGLSLMLSPHPSYPPLEMASFGMYVITNSFENKNLTIRCPRISSINVPTIENFSSRLFSLAHQFDSSDLHDENGVVDLHC